MATTTRTAGRAKPAPATEPARGRVQRIYPERGFGFIKCIEGALDDISHDFFFHQTGLEGVSIYELEEGETVVFTPTYVAKGKRAEHVQREPEENGR